MMNKLRILFVTHTVAMQGANHSMLRLIQELRDNYGVEPVVLMPHIPASYEKWNLLKACQDAGIECKSHRFYWFKENARVVSFLRCLSNLWWYPLIYVKIRRGTFSVVHSNSSVISLGAFLSTMMKCPHVWHLREAASLHYHFKSLLGKRYEQWVYKHADVFIPISETIKDYYLKSLPGNKIRMIYNGVLPVSQDALAVHNNAQLQFCMVGLLTVPKNQLEALKAINILINEWGIKQFHLTFIGFEEPVYTKELHAFIDGNGLGAYVTFLGERNDVSAQLEKMDVGLMLSNFEAFGRVTVEYMMQGLAVIACDTGANAEIVKEGHTGLICKFNNTYDLASKMRLLIEDRDQMMGFAEEGRKRALSLFSSHKNTEQIFQVYQELTQKHTS
ncbi:MAG: glycosyltransferase family 4 protein [Prevotella sp.]|nr:glycosyltransferase family 4 protein [Prevotella sp.]